MRLVLPAAAAVAALLVPVGSASAASAVQKECAAKYQAAKAANTLNGLTYNQYYKQCAAEARAEKAGTAPAAAPAAAPVAPAAPAAPTTTAAPAAPAVAPAPSVAAAPAAPRAPTTATAGSAVFPTAISPQYKSLSAGIARRKTCDDQYKINKANNGNGGLRWIEKGGGYYSECNKRLKT